MTASPSTPSPSHAVAGEGTLRPAIFLLALAATIYFASPQIGLALGLGIGLSGLACFASQTKKLSRIVMQSCIVLLGLRMNLGHIRDAGVPGLIFSSCLILGTFALGEALRRGLAIPGKISTLICSGSAICGGSAIAAVGTAIAATGAEMAVATGTVFILNGVALYLFPWLGHALELAPAQFGAWAGVAIHDVSSVVGAAKAFSATGDPQGVTETTATVVKLSRVIWIVPIASIAAWLIHRHAPRNGDAHLSPETPPPANRRFASPLPWFIWLFLLASTIRTFVPSLAQFEPAIKSTTLIGMSIALMLIGCGITRSALANVGWRPLAQAIVLWIAISVVSLAAIRAGLAV